MTDFSSDAAVPGGVAGVVDPQTVGLEDSLLVVEDSIERADEAGALTLANILAADKKRALDVFDEADLRAVEKTLFRKGGKPYLKCLATGKDRPAKPEEIVRQGWIHRLLTHYKYPSKRIGIEYPITFGRDTSKRADIVVFDADRTNVPYIIIEVKAVKLKDGKDQLKSYCNATGAPIGVWSDGGKTSIYQRRPPNTFIEMPELPTATQTIEDILNQPWTIQTLIDKEKAREKHKPLREIIEEMEDEVLANAGVNVFEEVFKLIFVKLYDEISTFQGKTKYLRFRNTNTVSNIQSSIETLFDEAKAKWDGVFPESDTIELSGSHLQICVSYLEEFKLLNSNLDIVDEAFEYLINKDMKGEKGQYFTPRWVIDMCVKMLNPQEDESLIDTACGSAGFTVHSIFHVWETILRDEGLPLSHLFTMETKPQRCYEYVREKVFAIDFDKRAVRVARCLNLIAGDGQTNVLRLNTLDFNNWNETVKETVWNDTYNDGWKKLRGLCEDKRTRNQEYQHFQFDVLMANPPFAGDIKQGEMLRSYTMGKKANGSAENAVGRDLLFVERNLDFLKPGGRMAVVLPQGRFNNSSDKRLREFIAERCRILGVVGLDGDTFKPHTGTKTSVLLVQKWNDDPDAGALCPQVDDYPIFFATQKVPSKKSNGEKILRTETRVRYIEIGGEHGDFLYSDFVSEYGFPEQVTLYHVTLGDGTEVDMTLAEINTEFGSLAALRAKGGVVANAVKRAQVYVRLAKDSHGHYFVQHDLFNHDGITQDGIAEAFAEFATREKLSFF